MVLSLLLISNRYVYSKAHLNAPILRQFASSSVTARGRKSTEGTANRASVRLYRILLKQLKALPELSEQNEWMLQPPLHSRDYGHARLWKGDDKIDISVPNMFRAWKAVDSGGDQEEFDLCTWITTEHLRKSIQEEFRSVNQVPLHEQHRQAIDAAQALVDQLRLIQHSSVSVSEDGNLRVIATSSCIGFSNSKASSSRKEHTKYQFAYRIRIENISTSSTYQLLGRTWRIYEYNSNTTRGGDSESKRDSENANDPILVDAPTTGAVGHLPVLEPGDVFSYMSGCQLQTREGEMEGCFHLAKVPAGTRSARVGDTIEALASLTVEKLKLEVNGFPLRVPTD